MGQQTMTKIDFELLLLKDPALKIHTHTALKIHTHTKAIGHLKKDEAS